MKTPQLPQLLKTKVSKTGQTRGADDDEIYQNRVSRSSTVLIPYDLWDSCCNPPEDESTFEKGFIVLISPETYFNTIDIDQELKSRGLTIGENILIFYETRSQWNIYRPTSIKGWSVAKSRQAPLGGQYVARIPATTATENSEKIILGFNSKGSKGAGIRLYEYASLETIKLCRFQLEMLYWLCFDADDIGIKNGMSSSDVALRKAYIREECEKYNWLPT